MRSVVASWSEYLRHLPTYSTVDVQRTRVVETDEEGVRTRMRTAEEIARDSTKPAEWMEDRCFVCGKHVDYLQGVYQTTGCTIHYGAAVTAALGLNQNTLNLVHLEPCYREYKRVIESGGRNCLLCRGDSLHKPQPEIQPVTASTAHQTHPVSFYDPSGGWASVTQPTHPQWGT